MVDREMHAGNMSRVETNNKHLTRRTEMTILLTIAAGFVAINAVKSVLEGRQYRKDMARKLAR
jgi:hypothetical protein